MKFLATALIPNPHRVPAPVFKVPNLLRELRVLGRWRQFIQFPRQLLRCAYDLNVFDDDDDCDTDAGHYGWRYCCLCGRCNGLEM